MGVVAASFTHFDSRDDGPQLHDHVVVLNRVQAKDDGAWRTLDSRGLFASTVMLSEMHQGVPSLVLILSGRWIHNAVTFDFQRFSSVWMKRARVWSHSSHSFTRV